MVFCEGHQISHIYNLFHLNHDFHCSTILFLILKDLQYHYYTLLPYHFPLFLSQSVIFNSIYSLNLEILILAGAWVVESLKLYQITIEEFLDFDL